MKMNLLTLVSTSLLLFAGCDKEGQGSEVYEKPLSNPTKVTLVQTPFSNEVELSWVDNCDNELGYKVWLREGATVENELATLAPDVCSYTVSSGLEGGKTYSIGVQAIGKEEKLCSKKIYKEIELYDYESLPRIELEEEYVPTPTSVMVNYRIKNNGDNNLGYGICWADRHNPTIEDTYACGPNSKGRLYTQLITCAAMDYDKKYYVRGYVKTDKGVSYGNEISVQLGAQPQAIVLDWTEVSTNLPSDIKVYKTESPVNGRVFNGWYAIADVTKGNVEFRFDFASNVKILEKWYEACDDNYIMTNAGYFNMSTGVTGDYSVFEGTIATLPTYCTHPRGSFAVDAEQKPYAYWSAKSGKSFMFYFNQPEGFITQTNSYNSVEENYPSETIELEPYYAMAAGPLLVYDSKVMIDLTKEDGLLVRNYEEIASDIFSDSATPDRTCVGYTADGKIILFICDGRIPQSKGASILEAAQIMKGLGCVGAVNFDGGGSTAMLVEGTRINSLLSNMSGGTENRSVGSVMGFYKKSE